MRARTDDKLKDITAWLTGRLRDSEPGERLPTVRELMRRFGTAQRTVEAALRPFIEEGTLRSRPGMGIVIADPGQSRAELQWDGDLLVLYRISDSRLARNLLQELEQRLKAKGRGVLQIGYSSESQALAVLERLGRFRTCLIQIHFQILSIDFLAAVKRRVGSIVIDGVSATGIDADAIGTNWREAVMIAHRKLTLAGHHRIGFLTSAHGARQIAMARREFCMLSEVSPGPERNGWLIEVDRLPGDYHSPDIVAAVKPFLQHDGTLPFTALIVWGAVEGYVLENALNELGKKATADLSVVLLGSTDFYSEHLDRFDVVGNSNAEKIDTFEAVILDRIGFGRAEPRTHYLPISHASHGSIAPP